MRSPRMMRVEKSAITGPLPKSNATSRASNTSLPDGAASCALRSICPSRSRRSRRSVRNCFERADSAFVASAPRLDALADPRLLLRELLVEQRRVLGLDVERGAFLEHVVVVAAGPAREAAAIELHDARRKTPDEGAIVAHEQQCARKFEHHVLEPADRSRCRDGSWAHPAATGPAPRPARDPASRAAASRRRACDSGASPSSSSRAMI